MNKNIIIAILVIIIIAIGAAFVLGQSNAKTNTQINIINNETFQNGEQVQFVLKDAQENALAGKNVEITFNNQKYSVTTDQNGKGYLTINDVSSGKYDVEVKYAGDDTYNGCDAKASITIDADSTAGNVAENINATANTNSDTSGLHYDSKYGLYYDDNGKVHNSGGQLDDMNINDARKFIDDPNKFIDDLEGNN